MNTLSRLRLLILSPLGASPLAAQTPYPCSWAGGNGGDWLSFAWAPQPLDYIEEAGFPIPFPTWPDNDRAAGSGTFTYLVTVPNGRVNLGSGSVTVATLVVSTGAETRLRSATLRVEGYAGFGGSAISNEGLISLGDDATLTAVSLGFLPSGLTINGSGTVSLLDEESSIEGSVLDFGDSQLVRGAGQVGGAAGLGGAIPSTVINRGTFLADAPPLAMTVQGAAFENRGTARALGGGFLKLRSLVTDNRELIESQGGVVDFQDGDVDNSGTLRAKSSGILQFKDQEVDNGGGLIEAVDANSLVQLRGGVTLDSGNLRRTAPAQVRLQQGTNTFTGAMLVQGQVEVDATAGLRLQNLTLTGEAGTVFNPQPGSVIYSTGAVDLRGRLDGNGTWSFNAPLSLTGPLTLNNLQFDVGEGQPVNMTGASANNSIIRLLDAPGGASTRLLPAHGASFTGTGELRFATGSVNRLDPAAAGAVFTNATPHTVTTEAGANAIVTAALVNSGTTEVAGAGSAMLIHNPALTNTGLLQARDGGFLRLNNSFGGTANYVFTNTGGTFRMGTGSSAQFEGNVLLRGGTVEGPGTLNLTGVTVFDSLPANPITVAETNVVINEFQPFTVRGTITNGGTLRLNDGTLVPNGVQGSAAITLDGNVTLNGSGRVLFNSPYSNFINAAGVTTPVLTNGPAHTITSAPGGRGLIYPATVNAGIIEAVGPPVTGGYANVEFAAPSLTNTGVISSRDSGYLLFNSSNQTIQNAGGFLRVGNGAIFQFGGGTTVAGGTLDGTGAFSGSLTLDGKASAVTQAATYNVRAFETLLLRGAITNNGLISVATPSTAGALVRTHPDGVTVGGSGMIRFGTASNNSLTGPGTDITAPFRLLAGATVTTLPGAIGSINGLHLTNDGTIEARGAGARVNFGPTSFTNQGVIQAVDGGFVDYSVLSTSNAGGILRANSGAAFSLVNNCVIAGGTLDGTGGFAVGLGTLDGTASPVTVATQLFIAPGQLSLRGAITNNGLISIAGPGVAGALVRMHPDGATVGGTGMIRFGSPNNNSLTGPGTDVSAPFRLLPGGLVTTLPGARGNMNGLIFTNEGTVESRGSGASVTYGSSATNKGVFAAAAGGFLALNGQNGAYAIENTGGMIRAEAGSTVALDYGIEIRGGLLGGAGDVYSSTGRLNGTVNPVTVTATVRSAGGLTLRGAIVNNGNLLTQHTGQTSVRVDGPVTVTGNGAITFGGTVFSYWQGVVAADALTLGAGQTVTTTAGAQGRIQGLSVVNAGTIEARGASSVLDLFAERGVANNGVIRAAGGTLNLGSGAGTFFIDNASGTIRTESGAMVVNATVRGGLLQGPGQILSTAAVLDGTTNPVTVATTVRTYNAGMTLRGSIVNNGNLLSQHQGQTVRVDGPVNLSGNGAMTFGNTIYSYLQGFAAADVLTLGTGQTMTTSAGGQGRAQGLSIVNAGTIEARGASSVLDVFADRGLTNTGVIRASDGATLYLGNGAGTYTVDNAGGIIRSESGGLVLNATVRGGLLAGPGQILSTAAVLDGVANPVTVATTVRTYNAGMTLRGSIVNNGNLLSQLQGQSVRVEGPVNLSGNGVMTFGSTVYSYLQGLAAADVLTLGAGQTLSTSPGGLGRAQGLSILNAGTVEARGASAVLDLWADRGLTNTGVIRAAGGGTLNLGNGPNNYFIQNAGGIIRNESGIILLTATVRGGRIEGPAGIYFYAAELDGTVNPVEIASNGAVGTNNGNLIIRGQIINNGRINLFRTAGAARLLAAESLTLDGSGEVVFGTDAANSANLIGQSAANVTVTNGTTHTVRVTPGSTGALETTGFVNTGRIVADGVLYLRTATFTNGPTGVIRGNNAIVSVSTPVLANQGTIAPGTSPGALSIVAHVTNSPTAVFEAEIGGTVSGTGFDRLSVSGSFARGGSLRPVLINGFRPLPSDSFLVLSATSLTGAWANVTGGKVTFEHGTFDVVQTATTVTLTNFIKNAAYTAYDTWMDGFPSLTGAARESNSDPDGDGWTNVEEFGYGLNPAVPGGTPATLRGYIYPATGRFRVEFPRRRQPPGAPYLLYELQFSSDLIQWDVHTASSVALADIDTEFELVTFEDTLSPPANRRRFARILVSLLP